MCMYRVHVSISHAVASCACVIQPSRLPCSGLLVLVHLPTWGPCRQPVTTLQKGKSPAGSPLPVSMHKHCILRGQPTQRQLTSRAPCPCHSGSVDEFFFFSRAVQPPSFLTTDAINRRAHTISC